MTPTLYGRWQTRILLLGTIGFIITIGFGYFFDRFKPIVLLYLLGYVILFGLVWDIIYDYIQTWRWDYDWPPVFQLFAGIWEGAFLWLVINLPMNIWRMLGEDELPGVSSSLNGFDFSIHYGTVWFITFLASQGLLRIIFPRWRYDGGEWL